MTTGSEERLRLTIGWLVLSAALLHVAQGGSPGENRKPAIAVATIVGTVFREPGFALPGAEVTLTPAAEAGKKPKVKKQGFTTNTRGEFAFHVPAEAAAYTLAASAKGFIPQQKQVTVQGEERIDVTFNLAAESKQ